MRIISPISFVVCLSFAQIVQGFICNGLMSVIVTSLERRFQLSSAQAGVIAIAYDIGFCSLSVVLPHWLKNNHRPKMIAMGSIGMAIGCLIFALPHYLTGPYVYATGTNDFCKISRENITEHNSSSPSSGVINLVIMIFGGVIMGVANIPAFTIAYTFIEDNISRHRASLCVGIVNGLEVFGAMLGFIIGGRLMSVYVDFDVEGHSMSLTQHDSRWVGAWWVGFLGAAAFVVLFAAIPLFYFPKNFRKGEIACERKTAFKNTQTNKLSANLLRDILILLKNKTFVLILVAVTLEIFFINALGLFLPKFIHNQFNLSVQSSSIITGLTTVPAAILGHFVSGTLAKNYCMGVKQMLKFCCIACVPVIILSPVMFLKCPTDSSHRNVSTALKASECADSCNCNDAYSPVCGDDHMVYISPCVAGCQTYVHENKTFTDCRCVSSKTQTVSDIACATTCKEMYFFTVVLFVLIFFSFATYTPVMLSLLRIVDSSHRSISLGIQTLSMRMIGSIPGPLLLGILIDDACLTWEGSGGMKGSCWIYDGFRYSANTFAFGFPVKIISTIFYVLAFYSYHPNNAENNQEELLSGNGPI